MEKTEAKPCVIFQSIEKGKKKRARMGGGRRLSTFGCGTILGAGIRPSPDRDLEEEEDVGE